VHWVEIVGMCIGITTLVIFIVFVLILVIADDLKAHET
jgi:hypothetical protein